VISPTGSGTLITLEESHAMTPTPMGADSESNFSRRPGGESLGVSLGPILRAHCRGQLGPIEWFHNGWQHSGAATGFSTWTPLALDHEPGSEPPTPPPANPVDVLVKLPVGPNEFEWTSQLARCVPPAQSPPGETPDHAQPALASAANLSHPSDIDHDLPTPRVFASGVALGAYDLAWLIIERFPTQTLAAEHTPESVQDLLRAAADFQERTLRLRPTLARPDKHDWASLLDKARHTARHSAMHDGQRWNEAIKKVQKHLGPIESRWESRAINSWCHGDLHPGNAMRRHPWTNGSPATPPSRADDAAHPGPSRARDRRHAVLIDLALVHPGHWVEDALYLERLYWGKPELLCGIKPVSYLAQIRRERGLPCDDGYAEIAIARRVLMAACVPVFLEHEGHPKYQKAALELLEKTLPQITR
jgi:Phosphotransferase enzyme family